MSVYPVDSYGLYSGPPTVTRRRTCPASRRPKSARSEPPGGSADHDQVAAIATDAIGGLSARQMKALSTKVTR